MKIFWSRFARDLYVIKKPNDRLFGPIDGKGMKFGRCIWHIDRFRLRRMRTALIAMPRNIELLRIVPENLQNIEFRRPGTVRRQQPECRPQSLPPRHLGPDLEHSICLRKRTLAGEQSRRIGPPPSERPQILFQRLRNDFKIAIGNSKRIKVQAKLGRSTKEAVCINLQFTIVDKGSAVHTSVSKIGAPSPLRLTDFVFQIKTESIKIIDKRWNKP